MKCGGWFAVLTAIFFTGCHGTKDIPAVTGFELNRYLGKWYEIARLPNWFERDMKQVSAEYFLDSDGSCRVINSGVRRGEKESVSGVIRFAGANDRGELEVSFFRPFYGSYRIIKLASDYRYSVVTSDSRDLLWILARKPQLSVEDMAEITLFLHEYKFPVNKLISGQ